MSIATPEPTKRSTRNIWGVLTLLVAALLMTGLLAFAVDRENRTPSAPGPLEPRTVTPTTGA